MSENTHIDRKWNPASEIELLAPLRWRKPRRVLGTLDLFENLPDEWIDRVFAVMALTPQHTYQLLTKRPERMRAYVADPERWVTILDATSRIERPSRIIVGRPRPQWPLPNVWLGTSVEDQQRADERIPELLATPAAVRFISAEPLLGPVDLTALNLGNGDTGDCLNHRATDIWTGAGHGHRNWGRLNWVIVGGESGPSARSMEISWARSLVAQCQAAAVAVFVKQLGAKPYEAMDYSEIGGLDTRRLDVVAGGGITYRFRIPLHNRKGGDMDEWPEDLRVRQFPGVRV